MEEQDRPVSIGLDGDVSGEFCRYFCNYGRSGASNANVALLLGTGFPARSFVLLDILPSCSCNTLPSLFPTASVVTDYNVVSCGSCHLPELPERLPSTLLQNPEVSERN